ncbi:MAG: T9SS type A sorting domain-containing protein [Saprospiraceae bacterium]|jgi:lysophospholipase L1-like esterase|uniref:GDSL-type esterase/lipase family protein n=1 Tax=Candidatus Brachybacter algidus TaxID=2982024 RepID=UPI001B6592A7|nr:GDSL-type esterase/lipase family protein [Candidatus Brachybacter algidus]MBP7306735.1 T9SS type A sorting domain-containing protein [Saprospiraceae bacterium]MBK6374414.1 T9SS type A sorting domain-containing protein [Candidatus Brachybacter algidus]MBK6450738.1 T9SS type A sorting domain-containing protein [Candidatus Brachybacter algidus]MBK7604851.1 T9SS type A sorting domain-containing protein [Candidatus Brachybacter algidus]MBK8356266.1 T9SS type A sorting domain-containing protein [
MKLYAVILVLAFSIKGFSQNLNIQSPVRMLALGDSYTIGQSVATGMRWPTQLGDSLIKRGYQIDEIRYIATTGWRTDDLVQAIKGQNLQSQNYNLVSLLIGVNNQFQHAPFSKYESEFPALLDSAIRYAGGDPSRVFVVSIPDYAFTPYGQGSSNPNTISIELDQYNNYAKSIADAKGVVFFNITPISRLGVQKPEYVANDNLHPSGIQYTEWVKLMLEFIDSQTAANSRKEIEILESYFPNPVNDVLNIRLSEGFQDKKVKIQIINMEGKVLMKQTMKNTTDSIRVNDLDVGLYFLKLSTGKRSQLIKIALVR